MKYSITIEGETKCEVGDTLYIFKNRNSNEDIKFSELQNYCNYQEYTITAIKPMLYKQPNWDGAIRFEFMCGTDAFYSENIASFFKEGSYRREYYNKDDAEKEKKQRIKNITEKLKEII